MLAERPVVASMWGGPSDVVAHGESGYLVNPLQIGVLADHLARLLSDRELATRMGRAGRRRAEQRFGLDAMVDGTLALYRELGLQA
jgi:glycosyltransferase involved in cell wall biosynthesis